MLEVNQISILDNLDLIGAADITISVNPQEVSDIFGFKTERAIGDLGYFDFFAFEIDGHKVAFRKFIDNNRSYSYVSYKGISKNDVVSLIEKILGRDINMVFHDKNDVW